MKNIKSLLIYLGCFLAYPIFAQPVFSDLGKVIKQHVSAEIPQLFERSLFLKQAEIVNAKLSPDGNMVAYSIRAGLGQSLYLLDTRTLEKKRHFDSLNLVDFFWADDSSLLYLQLDNAIAYLPVTESTPPAFIVAADYKNKGLFLGPDHSKDKGIFVMYVNAENEFLLEHYLLDGSHETLLHANQGERISQARLTPDGKTLFVRLETAAGFTFSTYRNNEQQQFYSCGLISTPYNCQMLSFDASSNTLWLTGNRDSNLTTLSAYAVNDGTVNIVHSDPDGVTDLSGWTLKQNKPVITQYANGPVSNYGLDTTIQSHLDHLAGLFTNTNINPTIGENDVWLLEETGAQLRHPRFYLYHASTRQLTPVLTAERNLTNDLSETTLSQKIPISYHASDGMLIHGYVSLPKGVDLSRTPFIAMPHPGPNGRVISDYHAETQFLVNRGYIVFEPNFRISTGYGKDYILAANREVGNGLLQQDIVDGIQYLLAQGIGDPERLGIYGFSYGGYAALTGLAYTPDLFKAGVAMAAGAADFSAIMEYQASRPNFRNLRPMAIPASNLTIVDVDSPRDRERIYQLSPRASIESITSPLLLLAGGSDPAAPIELTTDFVLAMVNQNKTISYFFDETLGHGNWPEYEASAYFAMMEHFFAHYLGGKEQPLDDEAVQDYIQNKILINTNPEFLQDR